MEKLQSAIQKARAQRDATQQAETQAKAQTPEPATPDAPQQTPEQAAWAALTAARAGDVKHLTRNRIVSHTHGPDATPFDILRTKVVLQMRKFGWTRLAITSATPACGKSTIAANLVFGMVRQSDTRAILIETDLRNPSLATKLGVKPPRDVSSLLTGEASFAEQALRMQDNVALSLAKSRTADPTSVLVSQEAKTALTTMEETYKPDLVIFDTAPVLVSDDTRAFLGEVDCALIVACAEKTTIAQIDTCEREIAEHTNVVGVILNQARASGHDTDYGYGNYGYGAG